MDGLKKLYIERLKPLEATYRYDDFAAPLLVSGICTQFISQTCQILRISCVSMLHALLNTSYPCKYDDVNCKNVLISSFQTNSDFDAKPMVMLLGQYSTGKTTFIKHLLKCDYPGWLNCG